MKMLYGSQNFGYDTPKSDRDWLEFVYPTWEDILTNRRVSVERRNEDNSITKIKDIRLISKIVSKANFNDLQFLYSVEKEDCSDLSWFFSNRERLVKCHLRHLFYSNRGFLLSCLREGDRKNLVRAKCFTGLIERAFSKEEFTMRIEGASEYILNEKLHIYPEDILETLSKIEPLAENAEIDSQIIAEMEEEITRLLKKNLLNGV